jgi:methionyl-tRNA formyltransferase
MRVVLCTSGGRPGAAVLRVLRANKVDVAGIVLSTRVLSPRYGFLRGAWEQYRRSGLRYTIYLGMASLGRIDGFRTRDINRDAERIAAIRPDLIVSAFFNQRIGAEITSLAPALNIHPSLLPAFKGVDPVFYARLRGAALGVTVHRISPELDSGDIVAQQAYEAEGGASVLSITESLYARGAQLLVETLGQPARRQEGSGNYDSWPTRADVAALRRKGVRLARLRDLLARAP